MAVGRLQRRAASREGAAHARQRSRPPGLHDLQRQGAHLLRPVDLQARRGRPAGRPGCAARPYDRERHLSLGGGARVVVGGAVHADRVRAQSLAFAGWVQHDVAQRALAQVGLDLDSLTRAAPRRDFRPVATGIHAAVEITSALRHVESDNVVARLPGSDLRLGPEAVLFTAHWDHKGIGPAVNGDSIYNGAEDNASGVAAMLAAAEALVEVTPRPRRTVLFIATTAEESGLLGSEAYVQAPLVPLERTAAVLDLDVTHVRGATRDIR